MLQTLKKYFGYESFRPLQKEIIEQVLNHQDILVLMPTGGGKSICYQLPALLMEGVTVVVSPLISLMKDQVEALRANGIPAAALNSSNDETENMNIQRACLQGRIKLLYISPERLVNEINFLMRDLRIALFAIDEAHCISQWGHDFRPEYTQLHWLKRSFPKVPIIALTATADKITRDDILKQLELKNPHIYISSFDRPNLSLAVKKGYSSKQKLEAILEFIQKRKRQCGIIYCMSRNNTEKVAAFLQKEGILTGIYHAGLHIERRNQTQEDFINDRVQVVCATIAFGMGIDKSNVRWIIHYNLPKSMENFYQEIGRAGRDGMPSDTLLFYSLQDIIMLTKFAEESGQQTFSVDKLHRMQQYAEADICRRRILLNYFGENMECSCGNCDVCKNPPKHMDGTILVQKALSAIARSNEQISTNLLVDVLRGNYTAEVRKRKFDQLKTFAVGREIPARDWQDYLLQMLQMGYFEIAYNEENHLKITESGRKVLFGEERAQLVVINREEKKPRKKKVDSEERVFFHPNASKTKNSEEQYNALFEALRAHRKELAEARKVPPYIIFSDKVLHMLATQRPVTIEQFGSISGIGDYKKEAYGKEFVNIIRKFK